MKNESYEVTEPDIEIVVRTGKHESCVIGMFRANASDWDVVVGIHDVNSRPGIQSALQLAIDAVSRADFMETRTLRVDGSGHQTET